MWRYYKTINVINIKINIVISKLQTSPAIFSKKYDLIVSPNSHRTLIRSGCILVDVDLVLFVSVITKLKTKL